MARRLVARPFFRSFLWLTVLALASLVLHRPADASAKPNASKLTLHAIEISSRAIRTFSKSDAGNGRYGRLAFRGGVVLRSSDPAFGGFSGIEISPDGQDILAVSDAGVWLKAKLTYSGDRPAALIKATVGPMLALSAKQLRRGRDRDAEAIRLLSGNLQKGVALVAFENNQRIGLFDIVGGVVRAPRQYLRPPVRLNRNKGIEAAAVIHNGPFKDAVVAFAERSLDGNGLHRGWLWPKRKAKTGVQVHPLGVTNPGGFDITDAVGTADGGLLLLERRFRWTEGVKMRIRRIAATSIKPGAVLAGEIMIEADLGYEIDNMEGIAVHQDKRKRTVITLISDDNFNSFLQRTILLQFEIFDQVAMKKPR